MNNNTIQMYDAQAHSIKIEDIATNNNNRIMLRRIRRNNAKDHNNETLYIIDDHEDEGEDCIDYVPEGAKDMGWLGYFISKNENLTKLYLSAFTPISGVSIAEVLGPFFKGMSRNKSITHLEIYETDLLGGRIFTMLCPFFENSPTLTGLDIHQCHLGDDGWRLLALAI